MSKTGDETGVCMFAWNCVEAGGKHLGTCIDRSVIVMGTDNRIHRFLFCEKQFWTCDFWGIFWHFIAKACTLRGTEAEAERE